jgi:hypothetical protein
MFVEMAVRLNLAQRRWRCGLEVRGSTVKSWEVTCDVQREEISSLVGHGDVVAAIGMEIGARGRRVSRRLPLNFKN